MNGPFYDVLRSLHRDASLGVGETSDTDLLQRFVALRDQWSFETLLRRHGPMVLGVCRRVLRDPHDAEDAFQATFLVFVRKARSIGRPELLANWLYGVALRTAANLRRTLAKQKITHQTLTD